MAPCDWIGGATSDVSCRCFEEAPRAKPEEYYKPIVRPFFTTRLTMWLD